VRCADCACILRTVLSSQLVTYHSPVSAPPQKNSHQRGPGSSPPRAEPFRQRQRLTPTPTVPTPTLTPTAHGPRLTARPGRLARGVRVLVAGDCGGGRCLGLGGRHREARGDRAASGARLAAGSWQGQQSAHGALFWTSASALSSDTGMAFFLYGSRCLRRKCSFSIAFLGSSWKLIRSAHHSKFFCCVGLHWEEKKARNTMRSAACTRSDPQIRAPLCRTWPWQP
jgi:hypothetical protein